jgi:uncharacterized protein
MQKIPSIWVLKGLRAGDSAQSFALANALGGRVEEKQLIFNRLSNLPNWFFGARNSHLTAHTQRHLLSPWPDMVVATGRRTAAAALWIKQQSDYKTKLVQIGRPRMALSYFDVVVTTPQYGLPAAHNVIEMAVPFVSGVQPSPESLRSFEKQWSHLPRPWCVAVVGGQKFPIKLAQTELEDFGMQLNMFAKQRGGSVIVIDSPRSPPHALKRVSDKLQIPYWLYSRGHGENPYLSALSLADELLVTSDSVSMMADMLMTGKPTWVFRLPNSLFALAWSGRVGFGKTLAARGILHPPRRVDDFAQSLLKQGYVGDLTRGIAPKMSLSVPVLQAEALERIKSLLAL